MSDIDPSGRVRELTRRYGRLDGEALLRPFIEGEFPGRIALVSSFGSEAAVLLHMAAEIDRRLPVIFLDTGKLFGETLRYRDKLYDGNHSAGIVCSCNTFQCFFGPV